MWVPWFLVRRRLLKMLAEAHDAYMTPECAVNPMLAAQRRADIARIGRVINDEDAKHRRKVAH